MCVPVARHTHICPCVHHAGPYHHRVIIHGCCCCSVYQVGGTPSDFSCQSPDVVPFDWNECPFELRVYADQIAGTTVSQEEDPKQSVSQSVGRQRAGHSQKHASQGVSLCVWCVLTRACVRRGVSVCGCMQLPVEGIMGVNRVTSPCFTTPLDKKCQEKIVGCRSLW